MSYAINLQFIFDKQIVNAVGQNLIDESINYANEVFRNSKLDYVFSQQFKDRRVVYDFKEYRKNTGSDPGPWRLLADMARPATDLGKMCMVLNATSRPKQVFVVLAANLYDQGMGRAAGAYDPEAQSPYPAVCIPNIGGWILAHELAHIFGANHCASVGGRYVDPKKVPPNGPCPDTLNISNFRTVESNNFDLTRIIPYFSNPRVSYYDAEKGESYFIGNETHDTAATIAERVELFLDQAVTEPPVVGVAATQHGLDRVELCAIGADGNVYKSYWNDSWSPYQGLERPGVIPLKSAAVVTPVWGFDKTITYAIDEESRLYERTWGDRQWSEWSEKGGLGKPVTSIAAVAWVANNYILYVCSADGHVWERKWIGDHWNECWYDINRPLTAALTAVAAVCPSLGLNKYNIYGTGEDGVMYERRWENGGWNDWHDLNRPSTTVKFLGVSATSMALGDALGVYGVADDGNVYERWYDGRWWNDWSNHGAPTNVKLMSIAAFSPTLNQRTLIATGDDNRIYERRFVGTWSGWNRVGF